jgi:hypothetical protein
MPHELVCCFVRCSLSAGWIGRHSLSPRWLIEKGFAWLKQTGPMRQTKLRGMGKVDWLFVFSCAAYNPLRLPKLTISAQAA